MDLNILTMDLRWICLFDTFFAWCEACAQNFLHTVGNLQFPLSSPSVPAPKDLVAGPVSLLSCLGCCHPCMKHFFCWWW